MNPSFRQRQLTWGARVLMSSRQSRLKVTPKETIASSYINKRVGTGRDGGAPTPLTGPLY